MASDADIANALAGRYGPVSLRYIFEQRDSHYVLIDDITTAVEDASVTLNNFRAITRSAVVWLRPARLPSGWTDESLLAISAVLRVQGEDVTLPLGLFKLDQIEDRYSPDDNLIERVGGDDLMLLAQEDYHDETYVVPAGARVTEAVSDLYNAAGLDTFIEPSNKTLSLDQVWEPNTSTQEIADDLLVSINYYPGYCSAIGQAVSKPNTDPAESTIDVVYRSDEEPRMIDGGDGAFVTQRTRASYLNQVTIKVEDPLQDSSGVIVTNDDPDSRISTVIRGATTSQSYNGDRLDCADCRAEYGRNLLRYSSVLSQKASLRTRVDPRRTAHEHYQIYIPGANESGSRWRALDWTINCSPRNPSTTMTHTIGRASELDLTVQEVS